MFLSSIINGSLVFEPGIWSMTQESESLLEYPNALRRIGTDPVKLARRAEYLVGLPDSELDEEFKSFHQAAHQHPSVHDSDYGALLLESLGDRSTDLQSKVRFYEQAALRAGIFASYATSGGEGLARMMDVERLTRKLNQLGK